MYKGYCINKSSISTALSNYLVNDLRKQNLNKAKKELDIKQSNITSRIAKILNGDANGVIDGEALKNACMPTVADKYDIFISHSHTEENEAKSLAAYLYMRYGLKCFVDGFVWGSSDKDILRPIDDIWSWYDAKKTSYSYYKRNYSTSLVHAMLSMALLEMIDKSECCIFIKPSKALEVAGIDNCTTSPWIYEEMSDLGNWASLHDKLNKDANSNGAVGKIKLYECSNCVVHAEDAKKVVLQGLDSSLLVRKTDKYLFANVVKNRG